jgi:proteasome lid subunit RPN8/RPN11
MIASNVRFALLRIIDDSPDCEICGFIYESAAGEQSFFRVRNVLPGAMFYVGENEILRAHAFCEESTARLLAFVHSHPCGTTPSAQDHIGARESTIPWIIVSAKDGRLEAALV